MDSAQEIVSPLDGLPQVATCRVTSGNDFQRLMEAEKPAVIKGLFHHWPALVEGQASPARLNTYLKRMDRGAPAPVVELPAASGGRCFYDPGLATFNFTKRQRGISETLDQIEHHLSNEKAPYTAIQMMPLDSHLPDFVAQNSIPLIPPQIVPRLWIGGALTTQTHNDRDHNLACVIAGRRRFLLFPPEQVANLYVGTPDNPPPLSLVDPERPDYDRFPKFHEAMRTAVVAHLEPGDAIFMPKYWWHHVTSLSPYNAMVNYWWGDFATGLERATDAFLTAILALGHLPPGERAYWQAMFDAYVFRSTSDVTGHIPPGLRGVLGPMSPATRERLKAELRQAYLKP